MYSFPTQRYIDKLRYKDHCYFLGTVDVDFPRSQKTWWRNRAWFGFRDDVTVTLIGSLSTKPAKCAVRQRLCRNTVNFNYFTSYYLQFHEEKNSVLVCVFFFTGLHVFLELFRYKDSAWKSNATLNKDNNNSFINMGSGLTEHINMQ